MAAGGIVLNERDELLMIFRRTKWDLPKGHFEWQEDLQECALREVREETGALHLDIVRFVGTTIHHYFDHQLNKEIFKETHWYLMNGNSKDPLIGQLQESIEWVLWVPREEVPGFLRNSYNNLREILGKAGVISADPTGV
jgi:ADP-ribose pyrophosphatase YjhB (NUDIX family)